MTHIDHGVAPNQDPFDGFTECLCGSDMAWEDCWRCGGEGYRELYDDDPLWYDVDDIATCEECQGRGGYYICCRGRRLAE